MAQKIERSIRLIFYAAFVQLHRTTSVVDVVPKPSDWESSMVNR